MSSEKSKGTPLTPSQWRNRYGSLHANPAGSQLSEKSPISVSSKQPHAFISMSTVYFSPKIQTYSMKTQKTTITDLVIGIASGYGWQELEPFVTSLRNSGYEGRCILIFKESQKQEENFQLKLRRLNIESYFAEFTEHPIIARFCIMPQILRTIDCVFRYVLAVDTRDIIFQSNPTVWLEKNLGSAKLIVASEGQRYRDNYPNRKNITEAFGQISYNRLADKEIVNGGVIAGTPEEVTKLSLDIYDLCKKDQRPKFDNPTSLNMLADQAALNILLRTEVYRDITKIAVARDGFVSNWCQLHRTLLRNGAWKLEDRQQQEVAKGRPDWPIEDYSVFRNGLIFPGNSGEPFTIFHQYDVTPEWRESVNVLRYKSMRVSIIIPAYNTEETLVETIESALAQTYENFDIVIVDDGSTDSSVVLADYFAEQYPEKVRVFHTPNRGLSEARNFGALQSINSGAFLFLDSDDKITVDYLAKTVPLLTENVGVVSTDMQYFGKRQDRITPKLSTIWSNNLPVTSLIRKTAFYSVSGYNKTIRYEDWDLWLKIIKAGWRIAMLNEPLFLYRIDKNLYCAETNKQVDKWEKQLRDEHTKTALLLIATGPRYHQYIDQVLASAKKYFVSHTSILWTDSMNKTSADIQIPHKDFGFPIATLRRYRTFLSQEQLLRKFDYLFYVDIDTVFVDSIHPDEILADGITATTHPGYVGSPGDPEKNPESTAYVEKPRVYFAGGFNGGSTNAFLEMAAIIDHNIDIDEENGIRAKNNDESHFNRYLYDNPPAKILTPAFCYPDKTHNQEEYRRGWREAGISDYQPKIELINKEKSYTFSPTPSPEIKKGVINVMVQGGLGNQLFQYALGRSLEKKDWDVTYDCSLLYKFPVEMPHDRHKPQYGLDGFCFPPIKEGKPVGEIHRNEDMSFDSVALNPHNSGTLQGHWQSEIYFENVAKEFRYELVPKAPSDFNINRLIGQIASTGKNSVAVQVRRGDYTWEGNIDYHGLMGKEYFEQGIQLTGGKDIFVITDDPAWCRESFPAATIVETHNRFWDIYLMSLCQHAVIANSTFGWWAAWIGDTKPGRVVVAPKRWFARKELHSENVVPARWLQI